MRICKICNIEKELNEFTVNKISKRTGKIYYKSFCNNCVAEYRKISKGRPNTGQFKKGNVPANRKEIDGKQSLRTKKWCAAIIKRDKRVCQDCSSTKRLIAHHIKNWNDYPELRFDLNNGITLCNSCHSILHGKKVCNLLKNGTSWAKGKKMCKEHCKKLSDAHKGIPLSEKHKAALRGRIPWNKGTVGIVVSGMKGKNHSIESRRKMSESRKGVKLSLEQCKKISEANKGRIVSEETKRKISNTNKGHSVSEETRQKLRIANIGKRHTNETKRKIGKASRLRIQSEESKQKISLANKKRWKERKQRQKKLENQLSIEGQI